MGGPAFGCGLRADGTVACWGGHTGDYSSPEGADFVSIDSGGSHACGLRSDNTIACWARAYYGVHRPPEGQFIAIGSGERYSCALRTDNTIRCWGDTGFKSRPPRGEFHSLALNEENFCALDTDGAVVCWGDNSAGQGDSPEGTFIAVAAGPGHTCGLRQIAPWPAGAMTTPAGPHRRKEHSSRSRSVGATRAGCGPTEASTAGATTTRGRPTCPPSGSTACRPATTQLADYASTAGSSAGDTERRSSNRTLADRLGL